jgi:large subunit ribosomal protein L11
MMFKGLTVPVRIECNTETKKFEIFVETPSTASLLLKEIGAEKGSDNAAEKKIGNLTIQQVMEVARSKKDRFLDKTFKNSVKTVLGTALSIGATVEGENPKIIQQRIDEGQYNELLKEEM